MARTGKQGGAESKEEAPPSEREDIVTFDYVQSNYYRLIPVEGVIGGVTVSGDIHMAVWNQRSPYPRHVIQQISRSGAIGAEIGREPKESDFVREVEAGLILKAETVPAMIAWLQSQLMKLGYTFVEAGDEKPEDVERPGDGVHNAKAEKPAD